MNTTDVKRFGRWPKMTTERAIYELRMMEYRREYRRACKQFDCAIGALSLFLAIALSWIVATF